MTLPKKTSSVLMNMTEEEKRQYPSPSTSKAFLPHSSGATVVLVEPQIPQNTGNIMRLCACSGSQLYLVGNLGFQLDEKGLRRSAMDYDDVVRPIHTYSFEEVIQAHSPNIPIFYTSAKAKRSLWEVDFPPHALLVFGSETKGLPQSFLEKHESEAIRIPMVDGVRGHNLANSVGIVLYEFLRQQHASISQEKSLA